MADFFGDLLNVLRQDTRFFDDDGKILRNKVREAANNFDEKLLTLLLSNDTIAKNFFICAAGVMVFDKDKFVRIINCRDFLPDSYTSFANKIGLGYNSGEFLSDSSNVVVVFPYKDCTLEGDQSNDNQKRNEIFFNETIAHDEITRLLSPKVLVNAVRYDKDAAQVATDFRDKDNLIIKGNNLLVLASLQERFAGKIKCIYIDPPYNTGSDSFGYNDSFNHSTWLTFMRNRLKLAKKLLADDGSIWISIDDDEQAYLKILCDEIFGRDNFVANVIWEKKYSPQNDATWLSDSHDFILVYAKNKTSWRPNLLPRTEEMNARYSNPDNDPRGVWMSDNLSAKTYNANCDYPITTPSGRIVNPPASRAWIFNREKFNQFIIDNRIWFGKDGNGVPRIKKFLSEVQGGAVCKTIWTRDEVGDNQDAKSELRELDLVFSTPKPERLIERILTLATKAGDLVLDYNLGSGTTAAVAHKMGRRYIGVEQMDYIQTLAVERLKKVIGGETGGISERVGWQGGGSFVYCELAKQNQNFVEAIEAATDLAALTDIYKRIMATGFISYKVNPAQIDKNWSEFAALTLADQKRFLMTLLDKNLLYVNKCDLDDEEFAIAAADKKFTRSFYRELGK